MRIEISHDILAKKIYEKASAADKAFLHTKRLVEERYASYLHTHTLMGKKELAFIQPHKHTLMKVLDSSKIKFIKKSEWARFKWLVQTLVGAAVIIIGLAILSIWALRQNYLIKEQNRKSAYLNLALEYIKHDPTAAIRLAQLRDPTDTIQLEQLFSLIYPKHYPYEQNFKHFEKDSTSQPVYVVACTKSRIATAGSLPESNGLNKIIIRKYDEQSLDTLENHKTAIRALAFSPDENWLVSGDDDGIVTIWKKQKNDKNDEQYIFYDTLKYPKDVNDIAFSPNGDFFAIACKNGKIYLQDSTGKINRTLQLPKNVYNIYSVALSSNNHSSFLAAGCYVLNEKGYGNVFVWTNPITDTTHQFDYIHPKEVRSVSLTQQNEITYLATGSRDGIARIFTIADGKLKYDSFLKGHNGAIRDVRFSPNGTTLLTSSWDRTAKLWDYKSQKPLYTLIGHHQELYKASFVPNRPKVITTSEDGSAKLWDLSIKSSLQTFGQHQCKIQALDISSINDTTLIATSSWDDTIKIWTYINPDSISLKSKFAATNDIETIKFLKNKKELLVTAGSKLLLFDVMTSKRLLDTNIHDTTIKTIAIFDDTLSTSNDTLHILVGGYNSKLKLWKFSRTPTYKVQQDTNFKAAPDANVRIYDCIFISKDTFATASDDGTLRFWDAKGNITSSLKITKAALTSLVYQRDGNLLFLAGHDSKIRRIKLDSLTTIFQEKQPISVFANHQEPITSLIVSMNGTRIISAGKNGVIKIWNNQGALLEHIVVNRGKARKNRCSKGISKSIYCMQFTPDERYFITGSHDGKAKLFHTFDGVLVSPKMYQFTTTEKTYYENKVSKKIKSNKYLDWLSALLIW